MLESPSLKPRVAFYLLKSFCVFGPFALASLLCALDGVRWTFPGPMRWCFTRSIFPLSSRTCGEFAWKLSTAGSQLKEGRWWGSEGPAGSPHGLNVNFEFTQSQAVFFPALVSPLWT